MAAQKLITGQQATIKEQLPEGLVTAMGQTAGPDATGIITFTIRSDATSLGVRPMTARVDVFGHFEGLSMKIDRTVHSQ